MIPISGRRKGTGPRRRPPATRRAGSCHGAANDLRPSSRKAIARSAAQPGPARTEATMTSQARCPLFFSSSSSSNNNTAEQSRLCGSSPTATTTRARWAATTAKALEGGAWAGTIGTEINKRTHKVLFYRCLFYHNDFLRVCLFEN